MVNSRQKGKSFELKICEKLKKLTGREWKPTPGSGAQATRTGEIKLAGDIFCPSKESEFVWECKKYKEADITELIRNVGNFPKWLKQLEREKRNKKGALVFSKNYGKIFILVECDKDIPNTFKYGKYTFGLFDEVVPNLLKNNGQS